MRIKSAIRFENGDNIVSALCNHMAEKAGIQLTLFDDSGDPLHDQIDILQQSPPALISGTLANRLKLLSPRIWWGIMEYESKKDFSPFTISTTVRSCVGLVLPFFILAFLATTRKGSSATTFTSPRLVIAALLSPLGFECLYQLYCQLSTLLGSVRMLLNSRSLTLTRATDALKLRIRHHRAYRTPGYDVYLPPSLTPLSEKKDRDGNTQTLRALLFIPGALVAHEAYSEVAARLSDEGFVVAVMSLEPVRLAGRHFGANPTSVKHIIDGITAKILAHSTTEPTAANDNKPPIETIEWTLMGHSMGSFAATQLFHDFFGEQNNNTQKPGSKPSIDSNVTLGRKLVLWGVAAFVNSATDLSAQKDADILILQGTNDEFVDMMQSRQDELEAYFPPSTRTKHIAGGTHEGFASYKTIFNNRTTNKEKTTRSIPLDQQHKRACDATVRFLRSGISKDQ